jgi:C4-dicarboxylate-specific signal transduction histidine kinase
MMVETDLREVAFFGKITAAFTHEMKNVLAIIKESGGLMEDLLALSQNATFPSKDRFVRSLAAIAAQTKRGIELSNRLNRFAHSTDEAAATIDLNDILEQTVFLSERFARLKGVTLNLHPSEKALTLVASPIGLQMAVFACLECCWCFLAAGGNISVAAVQTGQEAVVSFVCNDGVHVAKDLAGWLCDSEAGLAMQKSVKSLNGRTECGASETAIDLILPAAG